MTIKSFQNKIIYAQVSWSRQRSLAAEADHDVLSPGVCGHVSGLYLEAGGDAVSPLEQ